MDRLERTFRMLVAEHQGGVLRVCRSILGDEHLGADAAQETFLRLWRRLEGGSLPARFGGWLRRVAVSTSIDLQRRRRDDSEGLEPDAVAGHGPEPADVLARNELMARVTQALRRLSEGQRTVFLLRHFGQLSLSQVAEALGVSVPTVKTHFARACLKLEEALTRTGEIDPS